MTPERWREITDLFHAALARPAVERSQFLDEQCRRDRDLREEVCAMLDAHGAGGASDIPLIAIPTEVFDPEPGATVGPYEVLGLIGAGGMGQVYRAHDSRLDRDVAIKVLPSLYAGDPDRLRRFELEARASGALTHPNLVTVYDVGTANGCPYLVTELLDGETLRERLARGPMPQVRACDVASALARGLAAAHAKGIVHRDLKPENAILTSEGRVKILDFGVAKLRTLEAHADRVLSPLSVQTESGVMVGTAGYMAPEQIRGGETDGRADVFALGAIFFELLTGHRAFDRPSRTETLDATLSDDPLSTEPSSKQWPSAILRIVQRCLEKDPEARFQSAADLAFAIETVTGSDVAVSSADRRSTRPSGLVMVIAAVILVAVGAVIGDSWRARPEPSVNGNQLVRFALPIGARVRLTGPPAISPDGTTIVYPAYEGAVDGRQLYLRRVDQITSVPLPGTERAAGPFFSPDGEWVAFWADNHLKRTRLDGTATPVVICVVESFLGGAWTTGGTIVFASTNQGLHQVNAAGGRPQALEAADAAIVDHHAPEFLPSGRAVLITVPEGQQQFRIDALKLGTAERRTVIEDGFDARYISTGHIVYGSGNALFAMPFDADRLEPSGPPIQLLDGVSTDRSKGDAHYSLADTGALVFLPLVPTPRRTLAWVDRSGRTTPLPLESRAYWTPRLSPDGKRMAVVVQEQEARQIWIHHFDGGTFSRLTLQGHNWAPVWSRDGSQLVYASERNGQWQLKREALDGRAVAEVLLSSEQGELTPGAVSVDGRSLVYTQGSTKGNAELRMLDIDRRQSTTMASLPNGVGMPVLSPDGHWLGFTGWTPVRPSIFVRPVTGEGPVRQLIEGAGYTVWDHAGDKIYFRSRRGESRGASDDGVFEVPFDPIRGVATGPERQLFRTSFVDWMGVPGFDVSRDGRFLLVLLDERESVPRDPNVILNVDDELRRRTAPDAR